MDGFIEGLNKIGIMRLAIMGAVLAACVGFFLMISSRIGAPDMALLYADLDPADGGQIISQLETLNIPTEIRGGGAQIFVPSDQVARARMLMAEAGLPSGGSLGYEIFDKTDVLGSTSFVQDINRVRALEGEISRSIKSINNVASARVHLVMPKRELFARENNQPSASVILRMRGPRLNASQVQAIQHLVAAAVPGLAPGHISIIDEKGTLLARGDDGDDGAMIQGLEDAQRSYEDRMARTVETLLERSLGAGKVRAEVRADIDRNRTTENSEVFDPDGQVLRSSQSTEESGNSSENSTSSGATVTNNAPGAQTGGGAAGNKAENKRTDEVLNYEISKTIKNHIKEAGGISRLSVAVLVDGKYKGEGDKKTYEARSTDEISQIEKLVKSAVGFDEKRGDKVEIINMQFAEAEKVEGVESTDWFMGFSRPDVMRFAESIILAIVALLGLLIGVKPIITRLLGSSGSKPDIEEAELQRISGGQIQSAPGSGTPAIAGTVPGQQASLPPGSTQQPSKNPMDGINVRSLDETVERSNIIGRMKKESVQKIETMIDERTEEAVGRIRSWLSDTSEAKAS